MVKRVLFLFIFTIILWQCLCSPVLAESAIALNNKGVAYLDTADYKNAREYLEQAYKLAPENKIIKKNLINAYAGLSSHYANKSEWSDAILFGEKAHELEPANVDLNDNLAVIYNNFSCGLMDKGSFDKAYEGFNKALSYNSKYPILYVNLGKLMYQYGKVEETIKYWRKAVELDPGLSDVRSKLQDLEKEVKVGAEFKRREYSHFEVKYDGYAKQDLAHSVVETLEDAYYHLGADFNYYPSEKIFVIIYSQGQYKEVTNNPDWLPAQAEGGWTIKVTADDIEQSQERLKNVLYHEYVHLLLFQKIGTNIPRWLNEGLAQYKEPKGNTLTRSEVITIRQHIANETLLSLGELDGAWKDTHSAEMVTLAYLEAKLLVLYLTDRYNFYKIQQILERFKEKKSVNDALKETLYIDAAQFEQDWREWLKRTY